MSDSESESDFQVQKGKKKVTKKISKPAQKKGTASKSKAKSKGKTNSKNNKKPAPKKGNNKKNEDDEKADFLPGQKQETPDENDSTRVFYQSLYEQNPESVIAMKYCLEKGLIPEDEISKVQKKLDKIKTKKK